MSTQPLIDIQRFEQSSVRFKWIKPAFPWMKRFLCMDLINAEYAKFLEQYESGVLGDANFFAAGLRFLGVNYQVTQEDLNKIPKTGPLMVVSNHPFGCVDGLILGAILTQVRPDVRLLANELLGRVEPMRPYLFPVNVFGGNDAARKNMVSMRQAMKWLESEGCVATFPSGTVSHLSIKTAMVVDPKWSSHFCKLVSRTQSKVIPFYFEGRNSNLFQLSGLIHPMMRTVQLGREFTRMRNRSLTVRIGSSIKPEKIDSFATREEATQFLRLNTYILKDREVAEEEFAKLRKFPLALSKKKQAHQEIVPQVEQRTLIKEIESLDAEALLFVHGTFQIYVTSAQTIPNVLREIGRLREITFRAIGEGTGLSIDLDEFDQHYLHLFIWNNETCEIVGSYRIGLIDEILKTHGKKGLYLTTLFKLKDEFLDALNPALELGRSFIRIEYQKKQATLSLLWKGIGAFIGRNPQYARLIGGVSITAEYSSISKDLMVQFLQEKRSHPTLSKLVKARHPHRYHRLKKLLHESMRDSARTIEDVSALISEIESDRKGIPVLLKHYLRLNGVLLSFNRDPNFSDVVDGLILVDLEQADSHVLRKHIGVDAWTAFNAHCEKK